MRDWCRGEGWCMIRLYNAASSDGCLIEWSSRSCCRLCGTVMSEQNLLNKPCSNAEDCQVFTESVQRAQ